MKFEPGILRCFEHPDDRTYTLEVANCRVYESWTSPGKKRGQGSTSTRDSDADAQAFAAEKVRSLSKKGFVEKGSKAGRVFDTNADVVEAFRTDRNHQGELRYDFRPISGPSGVFAAENVSVAEWLVTSEDRRLGVLLRCAVYGSKMPAEQRTAMAAALQKELVARRTAIFADRKIPARKLPLSSPIGRFTHLAVLSPTTEDMWISRDVNIVNHVIGRSIYGAFPIFESEFSGAETVAEAEARTKGRGTIPTAQWDRAPHPVFDLAYQKKSTDTPKFLVFDPKELDRRLGGSALVKMDAVEVRARNFAGEVRRFLRKQAPPDLDELRRFFGYDL